MVKEKKGITLIALIITIIVLLILAGVTINMVLGENGLFNKAKTSVGKYENAQERENLFLTNGEEKINSYINGNRDYETEINSLKERIEKLENERIDYTDASNYIIDTKTINVNSNWSDSVTGPTLESGTWMITIIKMDSNTTWHQSCISSSIGYVSSNAYEGRISISGYYKGNGTTLSTTCYSNVNTNTTIIFNAVKISNDY